MRNTIYNFFEKLIKNNVTSHNDLISNHSDLNNEYGLILQAFVTYPLLKSFFISNNVDSNIFNNAYAMDTNLEDLIAESQLYLIEKTDQLLSTWIKFAIGSQINKIIQFLSEHGISTLQQLNANESLANDIFIQIAACVKSYLNSNVSEHNDSEQSIDSFNLIMMTTSIIYKGLNNSLVNYAKSGCKSLPAYSSKYNENAFANYVKQILNRHILDMHRKVSTEKEYITTDSYGNKITKKGHPFNNTCQCTSLDTPITDSDGKETNLVDLLPSYLPSTEFIATDNCDSPASIKSILDSFSKQDLYILFSMVQEKRQEFIDKFSLTGNKVEHLKSLARGLNNIVGIPDITNDYINVSEEDLEYTGKGSFERYVSNRRNYIKHTLMLSPQYKAWQSSRRNYTKHTLT